MELAILLGTLVLLMMIGVPVAISLGAASLVTLFALDIPLVVGFQRMAASMNIFALLAIPFSCLRVILCTVQVLQRGLFDLLRRHWVKHKVAWVRWVLGLL